ncbi:MAG: pyrimidine dimer DNA glycosylase/endonuclease V [Candidatus Aminicenantes bacterium]|nr:pyrimidine dimer DNA glycosylase/endonuclease V [Candidatus Aminicenantes bacterium]
MRIWDIPPKELCRNHLLGEHAELHALWSIITRGKTGYSHHPETLRWLGKLKALYARHELLVEEMENRGYNHHSPLNKQEAKGKDVQDVFLESPRKQKKILKDKPCKCFL